ncbi:MAG: glycosyltransferase family 39 protein, partial [Acidobacteria bacterium]|nr:glycosyltransferase family 39 protein [Acidobacteriota bacterium]
LVLRLSFALGYWVGKPLTLDEQEYLLLARSLTEGRGFTYASPGSAGAPARHFDRPPVYPLFVAGLLKLSRPPAVEPDHAGVPVAVKVGQSVLGAFAVWLLGIIALRAAGAAAGMLSAWIAAVYPPLIWICAYLLTEALYLPLALAVVWLLGEVIDRGTPGRRLWLVFAAGLVAGAAVLTREAMVFFLLIACAWLLATRRLRVAALLLAGALVVLLPWGARNLDVHGQFVLGAAHGGVNFWIGNNPLARGEGDMAANADIKQAQIAIEERHRGLTASQIDSVYYREARDYIVRHPAA